MIQIEQPLAFESFDKVIVSIMAKKVASGASHLVLDVPVGPTMKIQHFKDAEYIAQKFTFLAKKFNIKVTVDINEMRQNAGRGAGPILEARDVLQVLEQHRDRPLALEAKALRLAGKLLDLCYVNHPHKRGLIGEDVARDILLSGKALSKMREIIRAQGGNPDVSSTTLQLSHEKYEVPVMHGGRIHAIHNQQIASICRVLGCPNDKKAGIYLNRKLDEKVDKGDILCTLYSSDKWRLAEAKETFKLMPIYTIE